VLKAAVNVQSISILIPAFCRPPLKSQMQVIVALSAEAFGDWEKSSFAPETAFLDQVKAISGISSVETQTYTLMTM
jgi:hypothetical protein